MRETQKPAPEDARIPRRPTTAIEFGVGTKSAVEDQSDWRAWQQRTGCWSVSFQDWKQGRPVSVNLNLR